MADSTDERPPADLDDIRTTTREVGDEGGGPGEVEERRDVTVHDETGERRRNP